MSTPSPTSPSSGYSPPSSTSASGRHGWAKVGTWADRHPYLVSFWIYVLLLGGVQWYNALQTRHQLDEICLSRKEAREATKETLVKIAFAVPQSTIRASIIQTATDLPSITCP